MKTFIKNILFTLLILLSVFILGIILPTIVSSFIVLTTKTTFEECVQTGTFWFITLLGWLCALVYVNDLYKQTNE
jgi:hypothetical protein